MSSSKDTESWDSSEYLKVALIVHFLTLQYASIDLSRLSGIRILVEHSGNNLG
jgi:hypothetical protein